MFEEILLAVIQSVTEFLPVSSSGHLALVSNLISEPNLFLITILHIASLLAVLIFTRKEIYKLVSFEKNYRKMWLYLIIATIPAALVGFFFKSIIESSLSSFLFIGIAFFFTSVILLLTKINFNKSELNFRNSLFIGLFQIFALFPGVSRSGMTISASMFSGIKKEEAVKFSFLLFIPLAVGAMILEFGNAYFSFGLLIAFVLCFVLSLIFLNLLLKITKRGYFWVFSIYTFIMGIMSLILYFSL
jgi:undecaprenyl-diphosphatase